MLMADRGRLTEAPCPRGKSDRRGEAENSVGISFSQKQARGWLGLMKVIRRFPKRDGGESEWFFFIFIYGHFRIGLVGAKGWGAGQRGCKDCLVMIIFFEFLFIAFGAVKRYF